MHRQAGRMIALFETQLQLAKIGSTERLIFNELYQFGIGVQNLHLRTVNRLYFGDVSGINSACQRKNNDLQHKKTSRDDVSQVLKQKAASALFSGNTAKAIAPIV